MSWEEQPRDELGRFGETGGGTSRSAGIPDAKTAARATAKMMTKVGRYHPDTEPSYDERRAMKQSVAKLTGERAAEIAEERGVSQEEIREAASAYGTKDPDTGGYMSDEVLAARGVTAQMQSLTAGMVNQWALSSGDHQSLAMVTQMAAKDEFGLDESSVDHLAARETSWGPAVEDYENGGGAERAVLRAQYERTQEVLREAGITSVTLYRGTSQRDVMVGMESVVTQPLSSFSSDPNVALDFGGREGHVIAVQVPADRILSIPSTGFGAWNEAEVVVLGGKYGAVVAKGGDVYDAGRPGAGGPGNFQGGSMDPERRASGQERASGFLSLWRALNAELPPVPSDPRDHGPGDLSDAPKYGG